MSARSLATIVGAMITIVSCSIPLRSQSMPFVNQVDSISIHISLPKGRFTVGEKPVVAMAIENTSKHGIWFSTASDLYRIHVTRDGSEPPKTELYRHMLGDYRPGDGPGLEIGSRGWSGDRAGLGGFTEV
jgi:hypothetical protein